MACINPDGTLTPTALQVLKAAEQPKTAAELAQAVALPLYRVRSSLRELVGSGFLKEEGERFVLTEAGRAKLG
ncbi:MAG: hypothetical protein DDG59_03360 [Anaerolineae bacterium]|jgi:DNA-binding IclR family transcriptional regulator|nr:MAG: hypothetical protein DDG59_03360 [Anaerolineae bacterium]